jgi:hypothetical protein
MDDMRAKMVEYANGDKFWWLHNRHHRTDGPAIVWADGDTEWWINGLRHRTDGPAIEYADGDKSWFLHGEVHLFDQWLDANSDLTDGEKVIMKLQYG